MQSLTARNVNVNDLFDMLGEQQARKVDVVVKATDLVAISNGQIAVTGHDPIVSEFGVTEVSTAYRPNDVFQGHLGDVFKMGTAYTKRMAADRPDIWAANVNGWIHGNTWGPAVEPEAKPDARKFLFRAYSGGNDGTDNVARALLSDTYKPIDNIDVITATLMGIKESDADGQIVVSGADLSDRRMFVRFLAPTVQVGAQALLDGYRSPFDSKGVERAGDGGWSEAASTSNRYGDGTVLWAGFEVSNSEVGQGAYNLTPRAEIRVCRNGLKMTVDAERSVHLGAKLDRGVINWSQDTQRKQLALIQAKTRDAVATFLSPEYWEAKVAELAAKTGKPIAESKVSGAIESVGKSLGYTQGERESILRHFILGGQVTAGGVMNAVTSVAQTLPDADRAAELESSAVRVLDLI